MADPQQQVRVEALADQLSANADALHRRLMRAIGAQTITRNAAQALFASEVALRQQANQWYLDTGVLAASGLDAQRQQLQTLATRAEHIIERIDRLKDLADLAAELVGASAASASGKLEGVLPALEKLKHHIEAL
ncbi:hypothetical protein KW842_12105 [Duganella sp. sic0402]|uniref:hypothetical protein n=1 Tax=Duganella sp. sic0402 TaxID=2854786 RepID=UPI001C445C07|nr:hypothetical protein [Duganella sp. sic0402]MBV7536509.1 hypothetical protein [Duganella sp. sic0402]